MASSSPRQPADTSFQQAFTTLLSVAPGPVFPRARQLYLRKYPLEGPPVQLDAAAFPSRFRTFLLQEEIQEGRDGLYRVRGHRFAVVHWQAPQTNPADYLTFLQERWGLQPDHLTLQQDSWFRNGGAWACFNATAVYERQGGGELRVSLGGRGAGPSPGAGQSASS
ncbi:hypothetical protein [Cyanobium sp. NIES-981]|uniref:hypothetical protein n=1 Tax=Cyanobium sp. NIES-981 TaxID=1851505 RepID=UPI0007DE02C5|nr:hypothetical protein [Cyanobium sp. NIES-981]SBO42157.1 conserved protein of unknown function [Cyanobium sp. NIES-981]